jgi:hypothetical protein
MAAPVESEIVPEMLPPTTCALEFAGKATSRTRRIEARIAMDDKRLRRIMRFSCRCELARGFGVRLMTGMCGRDCVRRRVLARGDNSGVRRE